MEKLTESKVFLIRTMAIEQLRHIKLEASKYDSSILFEGK